MKTLNKLLLILFLSTLIYFKSNYSGVDCSKSRSKSRMKNKFKFKLNSNIKLSKSNISSKKLMSKRLRSNRKRLTKRKKEDVYGLAFGERPKGIDVIDKSKILTEFEKLKVDLQDWLQISSPEFRNPEKFPPIVLPDYSTKKIKITDDNFRINESFDETKSGPDFPTDDLYFWFRFSDKNFYYTHNKSSLNIIDSISIKGLVGVNNDNKPTSTCFDISDRSNAQWRLCAETKEIRHKWYCHIQQVLGVDDEVCKKYPVGLDAQVVVQDEKVTDPVILIPLPSKTCNEGWNFKNKGDDWECDCKEGKTQSPIDIDSNKSILSSVKPIFKYQEIEVKVEDGQESPIKLEYKDGMVSMSYNNFGKTITLDGNVFSAKKIIFHTPSNHKIDGRIYDLEMEIIHEGESKDVVAKYLILCVLFEKAPGIYNKFMDQLDFFNLPNPMFKVRNIKNNININSIFYQLESTEFPLWKPFSFYTYEGSLSSPPCTEGTIVYVKSKPIPLGNTTLQLFKEAIKVPDTMDAEGNVVININEPTNNRNIQPVNGRKIYYYNYVDQVIFNNNIIPPRDKYAGHYEKVNKKLTNYYHVASDQPSGLPGSFVVSEKEALGFK